MKKNIFKYLYVIVLFTIAGNLLYAQSVDTSTLNYSKLFGYALNANIQEILKELDNIKVTSQKDIKIKHDFENRFKFQSDRTDYFLRTDTVLNPLLRIFQDYWRKSMLDNATNYDKYFETRIINFFKSENLKQKFTDMKISRKTIVKSVYKEYIYSKGYYTNDIGKTGNLFDLLVWKNQKDTTYTVLLINDTVKVHICMMKDFYSLGWEEYATLGVYYPGGWTTSEKLFCVSQAYDLKSENFMVNYLSHEGQHFLDYKHYPKLSSNDLEYRAKLIELYLYNNDLYDNIDFFINNANYDKNNPHPFADFCVIRDLSRELFKNEFEKDIKKWKELSKDDIHNAAKKLFVQNTDNLNKKGKHVKSYIK